MPDEDPAITDAPAPEADVDPAVTPDVPAEAPVDEDPFAPVAEGEPSTFPREYVEKLRREGAKYRTSAKEHEAELERLRPYDDTFKGWEPEQVAGWQQFISQAQENPEAALTALMKQGFELDRETATALIDMAFAEGGDPDPGDPPAPAAEQDDVDELDRPLTRRDLERIEAEKAQAAQQAQAVSAVKDEAKELGYKPDAAVGSQDEFRYHRLLHLASNMDNDLGKAHEALVAEERATVQAHLDKLAQEADSLPSPTGNGGPGAPVTGAGDLKDAAGKAREWLRAQRESA